jgi:hypothetical protein
MDDAFSLVRLPSSMPLPVLKPVFTLEGHDDERATTLRRLLEKGHVSVAPLREPKLILHSHLPHVCQGIGPPEVYIFGKTMFTL